MWIHCPPAGGSPMACTLRSHTCDSRSRCSRCRLVSLMASWLTQERLLMRSAQYLWRARQDHQHTLQEKSLVSALADGTQIRGRGMRLVVCLGGILDQQ